MLTDDDIQSLIRLPKTIESKRPASGYREEGGQRRCELSLRATYEDDGSAFSVFVRQNLMFNENFSIGLRCVASDEIPRGVTLVRYNGPHGEYSRDPDGHYTQPHIHQITADSIASGHIQPQERDRQVTDRFGTFDQALSVFFNDIGAADVERYFPSLRQMRLFE